MGSKRGVGGEQKSKMNYRCKVEGCSVTPRGCDVPKHYKTKTDWEKVTELREVMGGAILERKLEQVDGHTRFCFEKGFTETKLPRWQTHVPYRRAVVHGTCSPYRRRVTHGTSRLAMLHLCWVSGRYIDLGILGGWCVVVSPPPWASVAAVP